MTTEPTPAGLAPFDLAVPTKNMWQAMAEPWPCPVCGRTRPGLNMTPLRAPLPGQRRQEHEHAACDRQIADWDTQARAVDNDPDYVAAQRVADEAQAAADQVWEGKLRALDLPEFIVDRHLARRTADALDPR